MFKRPTYKDVLIRIREPRRFIQILAGPRQTGKTTIARQIISELKIPSHYNSADEPALKDLSWIEEQWETARTKALSGKRKRKTLLILDEIQKISSWSEKIKKLWDEDSSSSLPLQVILLGSSPLLIQKGLTESLAGRFEIIPVVHWSFSEMRDAFNFDTNKYIFYGGYPGSAPLINNAERWSRYILDSLIETTISRDIFHMARIDKPYLLRRLFELGCLYSGRVLSYQKMTGQLQDAGNTVTLAHYLRLLEEAGMLKGLQKYANQHSRKRSSSPKFQVLNTALMSAINQISFKEARANANYWGRLVESAVGASLVNGLKGKNISVFYWSSRNREVDFVLNKGKTLVAIEVKSGRRKTRLPGIEAFSKEFNVKRKLLIGTGAISLEEFFLTPPEKWIS